MSAFKKPCSLRKQMKLWISRLLPMQADSMEAVTLSPLIISTWY